MKKVRMTRISGGAALRTPVIEGESERFPNKGQVFYLSGEGLEHGTRMVNTSPVRSFMDNEDGSRTITTRSGSVYKLEWLE